jgi:NAD(P)-dependent dehydrogenase (short-subunit alcohol dehydrogenase family)
MARLKDKVAIITGGAGDIGKVTAQFFLREGAKVLLVGRTKAKLEAVKASLGAGPDRLETCTADICDEADTQAFVGTCERLFGGVDILFANAGNEGTIKPLTALSVAEFDDVITTNVRGTWLSIKHGALAMAKRGGGSIVVNSSVAGITGVAGLAAYGTSKHALSAGWRA